MSNSPKPGSGLKRINSMMQVVNPMHENTCDPSKNCMRSKKIKLDISQDKLEILERASQYQYECTGTKST